MMHNRLRLNNTSRLIGVFCSGLEVHPRLILTVKYVGKIQFDPLKNKGFTF